MVIKGCLRDITETLRLVHNVFNQFIASDYSDEGCVAFMSFANNLSERLGVSSELYLSKENNKIIGFLEKRNDNHLNLFFVDEQFHGKGVGKELFAEAFGDVDIITVNSSPFAVEVYKKMGFVVVGDEQNIHGIRFVPMKLER